MNATPSLYILQILVRYKNAFLAILGLAGGLLLADLTNIIGEKAYEIDEADLIRTFPSQVTSKSLESISHITFQSKEEATACLTRNLGSQHETRILETRDTFIHPKQNTLPKLPIAARSLLIALCLFLILYVDSIPSQFDKAIIFDRLANTAFALLNLNPKTGDRLCIHKVISDNKYIQLTNYAPSGTGRGRYFDATQGVTGQALRNNKTYHWSFSPATPFQEAVSARFALGPAAKETRQSSRSFIAIPVGILTPTSPYPAYIIFIDSDNPIAFPDSEIDNLITRCASGIAPLILSI